MGSPEDFENFMTAVIHLKIHLTKLSRVIKKVKKDKDAKIFMEGYNKSKGILLNLQ